MDPIRSIRIPWGGGAFGTRWMGIAIPWAPSLLPSHHSPSLMGCVGMDRDEGGSTTDGVMPFPIHGGESHPHGRTEGSPIIPPHQRGGIDGWLRWAGGSPSPSLGGFGSDGWLGQWDKRPSPWDGWAPRLDGEWIGTVWRGWAISWAKGFVNL